MLDNLLLNHFLKDLTADYRAVFHDLYGQVCLGREADGAGRGDGGVRRAISAYSSSSVVDPALSQSLSGRQTNLAHL